MGTSKKIPNEKIDTITKQKLEGENQLHLIPLRITDTTLRDAHQSLWATRMRGSDIGPIVDAIDTVGYYSLEVWGGATFDVCLRFLREDPWERLRMIKKHAHRTPLQMLLRGQNLVGYRQYADDIVDRFVALACKNGIDIFRVFDSLNDTRNMAMAIQSIKRHGGHAQGTLAYTISPVHTVEKFVEYAKEQVSLGIDSLCIKDMAGILSPIMAERLVSALIKAIDVPIQLHCHNTSGMATATYVEGVRAGAGAIDCTVSSMSGSASQPPVETLVAIFKETNYSANLDMNAIATVAAYFEKLSPKRKLKSASEAAIDPGILIHQIPGGMISNFRSQLDMQGALDKLPDTLAEVARVRKDFGYPPLVTPTSQIVGAQAVLNVLTGERYKNVSKESKDYIRGMYGRIPGTVNPEIIPIILKDEKPITHRPADLLKPMLPHAVDTVEPELIRNEEDIISYCIFPEPSLDYFNWRKLPEHQRPPTPADRETADEQAKNEEKRTAGDKAVAPSQLLHYEDYKGIGHLLHEAVGLKVEELVLKRGDLQLSLRGSLSESNLRGDPSSSDNPAPVKQKQEKTGAEKTDLQETKKTTAGLHQSNPSPQSPKHTIKAPIGGIFYSGSGAGKTPFVKSGDTVKKGNKVCVIEAMKLFNEVIAPADGTIIAFLHKDGDHVRKDEPLIEYQPL